jgi:hypothetical protein
VATERVEDSALLAVLRSVDAGTVAKEAIPDLIRTIASGVPAEEALRCYAASSFSVADVEAMADRILRERADFVRERGRAHWGP